MISIASKTVLPALAITAIAALSSKTLSQELDYAKAVRDSEGVINAFMDGHGPLKEVIVYKWANAATSQQVGQLVFYMPDDNRPVAGSKVGPTVARFIGRQSATDLRVDHEVVSLTPKPLEFRYHDNVVWSSPPGELKFVRLDKVPVPEANEQRRTIQARAIARDFSAQVDEAEAKHANAARQIRLLPTPVHRYGSQDASKEGTISGNLFLFVIEGGNPEVVLIVEAVREKGEVFWQYGISRQTVSGLSVDYQGNKIWEVPRVVDNDRTRPLFRIRDPTPRSPR